jgi:hypothetical protein
MHASHGPSVSMLRGPCSLAGMTMALARAITRIIPRPCAPTRGNQGLARMAAASTRPCVGIPPGAAWRPVVGHAGVVGLPLRVGTAPPARLARVARDEAEAWRPSVGLGAVPCALMGAPAGWRAGVARRGAFVLPRAGTTQQPPRRCPASGGWGPARAHRSGGAAAESGAACATGPARGPRPPPSQGRRSWPRRGADRPRQPRLVAVTGPTTGGGPVALRTAPALPRASAARVVQSVGVEVPLQPQQSSAIVASCRPGNVDHPPIVPQRAR